jgi:hypothetical protein
VKTLHQTNWNEETAFLCGTRSFGAYPIHLFLGKKKLIDVAYSGNVCRHYHQKGSKGTLPAPWNVLENH